MTLSELTLYWLTIGFEVFLCAMVLARKTWRHLPFFSIHALAMLAATVGMQCVYYSYGFASRTSFNLWWISVAVVLAMRFLAVAELCQYGFRAYAGVWSLAWRTMVLAALLFLVNSTVDAWGQINRVIVYGLTME